ncbi:hypothetical protein IB276_26295 [Ensifer sp. ENS04]|uniref:hypothetical protein n=1 Tax=Ensifer sp. ENS04 TaxID=2769281 RepID=UPI00177C8936|nr:hypothetical protein [Ensifer sp. ENS04]MBD9542961.1 hypothetical protein [Ensifer sp. ENS04]
MSQISIGKEVASLIATLIAQHHSHEPELDYDEMVREAIRSIDARVETVVAEIITQRTAANGR